MYHGFCDIITSQTWHSSLYICLNYLCVYVLETGETRLETIKISCNVYLVTYFRLTQRPIKIMHNIIFSPEAHSLSLTNEQ